MEHTVLVVWQPVMRKEGRAPEQVPALLSDLQVSSYMVEDINTFTAIPAGKKNLAQD